MPLPTHLLALLVPALLVVPAARCGEDKEELFKAKPLTAEKSFTAGIEGPGCDAGGNVYAVNYQKQGTIGRVTPDCKAEVWAELPGKSVGNGIVFDEKGKPLV